jgi:hypothetical protein
MRSSLNRVKEIVAKIRHIEEVAESKGKGAAKYITDRCNTILREELKDGDDRLNIVIDRGTGELISEPNCSYRYYSKLMEDYRNGVKSLGFKHHAIERNVSGFLRKYSDKNQDLKTLLDPSLPIEKLRENMIKLRAKTVTGSDFRRDLLSLRIEHHAYYMFEPIGAVRDWIGNDDKQSLNKKLHSQILINPTWIKATAERLLTSKDSNVADLAIGLAMATGRRMTEIFKTAEFTVLDDSTLLFNGQLKTKNRKLFEDVSAYEVPTMVKASICAKALQRLRKDTKDEEMSYPNVVGETVKCTVGGGDIYDYYHNRAVQKKYEGYVNGAVRSLFNNGHFSFKDCRAMYTEVTYEEHANEGEARSAYRHRVLGHSLIETQLHYEAFKLDANIESVERLENKDEGSADKNKALIEYISLADKVVAEYIRAPKIALVHEWLKKQVEGGLTHSHITVTYLRRHCLIDGKQLNANTVKKYLEEFVKIDAYTPPKDKPKNPHDKKLAELKEQISELEGRSDEIQNERDDLEREQRDLRERLDEIEGEDEELELEADNVSEQHEELVRELEALENPEPEEKTPPKKAARKSAAKKPVAVKWPAASEIEVKAVKDNGGWLATATVNGQVFDNWQKGTKKAAVADLLSIYNRHINDLDSGK